MTSEERELQKARAELRKAGRELVDRTEVEVRDPRDRSVRKVHGQALLEQLRDAVSNAGGPGGKRAGTGSPELLSLAALTLLRQLELELVTMHVNAIRDQSFTLDERIRAVVAMTRRRADVGTTTASTERLAAMADQIRDLLDPAKQLDVVAACPECGERTVWRKVDGESVRMSALSVDVASGKCVCLGCKTAWDGPGQLNVLVRMIRAAEVEAAVSDAVRRDVRSGNEGSTGRTPPGTKQCARCNEVKLVEQFPLLRPNPAFPRVRTRAPKCALCIRAERDTPPAGDGQVA